MAWGLGFRVLRGVSETGGPRCSTPNSRILILTDPPRSKVPLSFGNSHIAASKTGMGFWVFCFVLRALFSEVLVFRV